MPRPRIGMTRVSLEGTFESKRPFHDPLEAIVLLAELDGHATAVIALDLCFVSVATSHAIREAIEARTDIRADRIVTHCTHTHTGPWNAEIRDFGIEPLAKRLSDALLDAQENAVAAEMAYVEIDTGEALNVNRRKVWGDIGAVCVHMGGERPAGTVRGAPDYANINHPRLRHILGPLYDRANLPDAMPYDGPTDARLQAVYLRSAADGSAIGSIVRFAAHPATAGHTYSQKQYSADFPGVVRRHIANAFGGECAFLTGSCGNLLIDEHADWPAVELPEGDFAHHRINVPWLAHRDPHSCWREVERQGETLWRPLVDALPKDDMFKPIDDGAWSLDPVTLAVRDDLPPDTASADARAAELSESFKAVRERAAPSTTPGELKRIAEQLCFHRNAPIMRGWYDVPEPADSKEQQPLVVNVAALRLGEVCLLGLPGESFWETPQAAVDIGAERGRHVIGFTEANGDIGYIPTRDQIPLGDYETYVRLAAEGAAEQLERAAKEAVVRIG